MDIINLDEDTQQLSFAGLEWDDYFDLESPTEQTIAITLDEDSDGFAELGIDDDNFEFDSATDQPPPVTLDAAEDPLGIADMNLGDELVAPASGDASDDSPAWLRYEDLGDDFDSDEPGRRGGRSPV